MLICCVIALLFCITGNAKVPYIPKIINYSVSDYKAGNQNWAVAQGPGGKMYIGNNRGLVAFDGIHWDLVKLPNNLGVRALYISKEGRIYVGSFEEFGYFEVDDENDLIYHSLSSSEINVYLNNDEFWTINEYKGEIYFQSFGSFFIYDGEKVRKGVSDLPPLDNGIAQIHVNSPIYFYEPLEAQIGMVHDMVIEKDIIYLATNQGLYALSENDSYPTLVPGTQEQTWYISDVGNQLIAGHNTGTLQLEGRKATQIPGPNGGGTALRKTSGVKLPFHG